MKKRKTKKKIRPSKRVSAKASSKLKISRGIRLRKQKPKTLVLRLPLAPPSASQQRPVHIQPAVLSVSLTELPERYDDDWLVLLPRDPRWIFAYWELREQTVRRARVESSMGRAVVRVYDVTDIHFNGHNSHHQFDIEIELEARNWYINVPSSGRSYLAEIGFRAADGRWVPMIRSNTIAVPAESVSPMLFDQFITVRFDVPLQKIDPILLRKIAEGKPLTAEERKRIFSLSAGLHLGLSEEEIERQWREQIGQGISSSRMVRR